MAATLACLPLASHFLPFSHQSVPQSSSAAAASKQKWTRVEGPVEATLLPLLEKMYWSGVQREMTHILLTLGKWQKSEDLVDGLGDEKNDLIHGFDTFMDQVSDSARDFAARYGTL
jgi:hypothetical protein